MGWDSLPWTPTPTFKPHYFFCPLICPFEKKNMLTLNILGRTYIFEPFFTSFRQFCRIFRFFHSSLINSIYKYYQSCVIFCLFKTKGEKSRFLRNFIRGTDRFFASYDYWTS
jgi:hypothetical protein